jgi:molybdopterin molybdotransferase
MTATLKTLAEIAGQLAGYDPQALRADTVNEFLASLIQPVTAAETLPLKDAFGRVLSRDVISPIDVPAHDNSAMDGYAFDGAALHGEPLALEVVGTALAGAAWSGQLGAGQCVKIMTGAVMPAGLNTVVPQELVSVDGTRITIPAGALQLGDNRRFKGEDLALGKPALLAGDRITPAALGLLASLGLATVEVLRPLRVAFFSTGDEILSLGESPREGAVYDSNRYTLFGLLTRMGVELVDMGVVKDDPLLLEAAFRKASEQADAIITSGGVSVGEADHTKAVMRKMAGGDSGVAFWKIAMRPGRPMAVGRIGRAVLFGLPGNPVAVMVTFLAFVRPALLRMMGCTPQALPLLKARSTEAIRKKPGRTEYQRGTVTTSTQGELQVQTTGQQGSGVLSSMAQANGLIVLHHDQGNVAIGDVVDVMMFDGAI